MVLQAFMDESESEGGHFVLAGLVAPVERWAAFSAEWERMLPFGTLSSRNDYHFKMNEMAQEAERLSRVRWFMRIAQNHAALQISCAIRIKDLERAAWRVTFEDGPIVWGSNANPYAFALTSFLDAFHRDRKSRLGVFLPPDETIDFLFDDRSEKEFLRNGWNGLMLRLDEEDRKLYGNEPRFEQDEEFLPLQAADMIAWLIGKSCDSGRNHLQDFLALDAPALPFAHYMFSEQEMVNRLAISAAMSGPLGKHVIDRSTGQVLGIASSLPGVLHRKRR